MHECIGVIRAKQNILFPCARKLDNHVKRGHFLKLMGTENRVFTEALPDEESHSFSLGSLFFAITTSINPDDPRSLLGRELPGFSLFDTTIHIAGEGTDYTSLPVESSPPDDLLASEQKAKQEALDRKKAEEEAAKKKKRSKQTKRTKTKWSMCTLAQPIRMNHSFLNWRLRIQKTPIKRRTRRSI